MMCSVEVINPSPILVTGAQRSGTTWVGRMLALAPGVVYIYEPFNINKRPTGFCDDVFPYWFTYISKKNENQYEEPIRRTINLQYQFSPNLLSDWNSICNVPNELKDYFFYNLKRMQRSRALIKDPISIFSAEWLSSTFNMQTVVMIRHPAAFVASILRKGWRHPFGHFLAQPDLIKDLLSDFETDIKEYAENPPDIIDEACLLWRMIYLTINKYRTKNPDWRFVIHEEISLEPVEAFKNLYDHLDLEFSPKIKDKIRYYTQTSHSANGLVRDSKKNIYTWKETLSEKQIYYIFDKVKDVSQYFYDEKTWNNFKLRYAGYTVIVKTFLGFVLEVVLKPLRLSSISH